MTHPLHPVPVKATRDIRQHASPLIPRGTPGEILSTRGTQPTYYTVTFWLGGLTGPRVTIPNLHKADLVAA